MKKLVVDIAIPTHEANMSLVSALNSVYSQSAIDQVAKILLVVDGNRIKTQILKKIRHPKLKIIVKSKRQGQSVRINDIFKLSRCDLLVLTNDDVILKKDAIQKIIKTFIKSRTDIISVEAVPLRPKGILEKILNLSNQMSRSLAAKWNKGDNYLSCNGRLISLSYKLYKSIKIPHKLWNNDAYLYMWAKINHFTFAVLRESAVYYMLPHTLKEHFNQSIKFSFSREENQKFFSGDISDFYNVPFSIKISVLLRYLTTNPFALFAYTFILLSARLQKKFKTETKNNIGFWETDTSTKKIYAVYEK